MTGPFVHLHVHSDKSLLDGMGTPSEIARAAAADGQTAVAVTDHGSLAGLRELVTASESEDIKPILGLEAYVAIGDDRHANHYLTVESNDLVVEDSSEGGEKAGTKKLIYHHVTLLAKSEAGWKNLMRIHAESHSTFWSKPRIDTTLIDQNSEGIIILTGCLGGMIAGPLSRGDEKSARTHLGRYIEVVGADNVYVEIMDHGLDVERRTTIPKLVGLADEYDLPLVATNDCHYVGQGKAEAHDAWLALQSSHGKKAVKLSDPNRFRFNGDGYHMRTAEEMYDVFSAEAMKSVAESTDAEIDSIAESIDAMIDDLPSQVPAEADLDSFADDVARAVDGEDEGFDLDTVIERVKSGGYGDFSIDPALEVIDRIRDLDDPDDDAIDDVVYTLSSPSEKRIDFDGLADDLARAVSDDESYDLDDVAKRVDSRGYEGLSTRRGGMIVDRIRARVDRIDELIDLADWWTEQAASAAKGESFWTDACRTTQTIADRVDAEAMPAPKPRLPKYPVPDGYESEDEFLRELIISGAKGRYDTDDLPDEVIERINDELDVIIPMGFSSYFLIVWDLITWAKKNNIRRGRGRGSAAGAFVSYCLDIVGIDALRYNLLFERFLEPGRPDFPDIDLDFEKSRRDEVIAYLSEKWGASMVAKIGTFGQSLSKWAVQSAGRLLGDETDSDEYGYAAGHISAAIPYPGGKPLTFDQLGDAERHDTAPFWDAVDKQGTVGSEIVDLASSLTGYATGSGIHACGILIGDEPLEDVVPLRRNRKTGYYVTEWEGSELDAYGCLKLDVLGIRNHDILTAAVDNVELLTGETIDTDALPDPDDPSDARVAAAWDLIGTGRTQGLFQIESSGMQELCRNVKPRSMSHLSAVLALYRPGPMAANMHNIYAERKAILEDDPDADVSHWYDEYTTDPDEQAALAEVLSETYGTLTYQEQMMRLSTVISGFDATWRSKLRKAVGKKKKALMDEVHARFIPQGAEEQHDEDGNLISMAFSPATVENLWAIFHANADYAFNASHSYAYADLTFTTAYFKANWPSAYCAGLLKETGDKDKRQAVLTSLMAEGIDIGSPDVNVSQAYTAPVSDTEIVFGLSEIKEVGASGDSIIDIRGDKPFSSLSDFFSRTKGEVTSAVYVALAEAGALDSLLDGAGRRSISRIARAVKAWPDVPVPDMEWEPVERARRQSERLKVILADDHPMKMLKSELSDWRDDLVSDWIDDYRQVQDIDDDIPFSEWPKNDKRAVKSMVVRSISTALSSSHHTPINCVGLVTATKVRRYTKREGRLMVMTLQSTTGQIDCIIFDRELDEVISALGDREPAVGDILCVSGAVQVKEGFRPKSDDEGTGDEAEAVAEYVREIVVDEVTAVELDELGVFDSDEAEPTADMSPVIAFFSGGDPTDRDEPTDDPEPDEDPESDDDDDDEPEADDEAESEAESEAEDADDDPAPTKAAVARPVKPAQGVCDVGWSKIPLAYLPEGLVTVFKFGGHPQFVHFCDGVRMSEIDDAHSDAHQGVRRLYTRDAVESRVPWTRVLIGDDISHVCVVDDIDGTVLGIGGEPMKRPLGDGGELGNLLTLSNERGWFAQPLLDPGSKCSPGSGGGEKSV